MKRFRKLWLRGFLLVVPLAWAGCNKSAVSEAELPDKPAPVSEKVAEPAAVATSEAASEAKSEAAKPEGKPEPKPAVTPEPEAKPAPAPVPAAEPDAAAVAAAAAREAEKAAFAKAVGEAKAKVVVQFPEIGKAGSPLNLEFVALAKAAQAGNDEVTKKADWPLLLAARAAENLERKEKEAKAAEEAAMKAKAKAEGLVTVSELTGNLGEYQGKQVTISGKVTKASIFPPSFVFIEIDERVNFNLPVKELLPELKDLPRLQMKDGKVVALTFRGSMEPPKAPSAKPDGFKPLAEAGMTVKVRGEVEVKGQNTAGLIGPKIVR
jgi:hypothetical protein